MSLSKWFFDTHDAVHSWAIGQVSSTPRWLLYSGVTAGVGLFTTAGYFYRNPITAYNLMNIVGRWKAGLTERSVVGEKYTYNYLERGTPSSGNVTMVFINGGQGSADDWINFSAIMPKNLHMVFVDLPTQGKTTRLTEESEFSLSLLADYFHEFVSLTKLSENAFHLVGISIGGSSAGIYAATHPEQVLKLTLMCPALQCPIETELWQLLILDEPTPGEDFTSDRIKLLEGMVYNKNVLPKAGWIMRAVMEGQKKHKDFEEIVRRKVKEEIIDNKETYESTLAKINTPVQLIWGEEDSLLHVSGASLLEDIIPSVKRTDILPKCGHLIPMEQPEVTKNLLMDFYNTTYST